MNVRELIRKVANSKAHVQLGNKFDENGELEIIKEFDVKARKESSNSTVYTREGVRVNLKKKLFIFESLAEFKGMDHGFCTIDEERFDIATIKTLLNLDGTINHIVLELF